jgi:TPR repeat protein
MGLTYEKICRKYYKTFKSDINPILKNTIEDIYNGLYDLDNIILNDNVNNGDIYLWIGNYYYDVTKNYEEMKKYYLMAIKNGNSYAMMLLGVYYQTIEKNCEEMKKYHLMAIKNGSRDAIFLLGCYYQTVEINYEEMKKYFLMAIKNGDSVAMYNLCYYYDNTKEELIDNLYISLLNINNKNDIIDDKITELLNKYEHLKDVYISPILK